MKIGLLSDTHSFLDGKVFDHFATCDEIWHAGDIGDLKVAETLEAFKPFRAVYGNIDDHSVMARFPEDLHFVCEGVRVWITHIGGTPPGYKPRIKKKLKTETPDLFICGHSHILKIGKDPMLGGMLYVNPGAAGNHGFHTIKTLVRFELTNGNIANMEVIELGRRGALK